MELWEVTWTIMDAKRCTSTVQIRFPPTFREISALDIAAAFGQLIEAITTGTIVRYSIAKTLDWLPQNTPHPDSDVEEKAEFEFLTTHGHGVRLSIPTINEVIFLPGSNVVDMSNPDAAAFVAAMIEGVWAEADDMFMQPCDVRGVDIAMDWGASATWKRRKNKKHFKFF